jgi:hypothetical protein
MNTFSSSVTRPSCAPRPLHVRPPASQHPVAYACAAPRQGVRTSADARARHVHAAYARRLQPRAWRNPKTTEQQAGAGAPARRRTRPVTVMSFIWLFQLSSASTRVPRYVSPVFSSTCGRDNRTAQSGRPAGTRRSRATDRDDVSLAFAERRDARQHANAQTREARQNERAPSCSSRSGTPTPWRSRARSKRLRRIWQRGNGARSPCWTWRRAGLDRLVALKQRETQRRNGAQGSAHRRGEAAPDGERAKVGRRTTNDATTTTACCVRACV